MGRYIGCGFIGASIKLFDASFLYLSPTQKNLMKMSKLFGSNMSSKKALLSLVVPVFNECEAIPFFLERINVLARKQLQNVSLELVFVNDGSKDETLNVLLAWQQKNPIIKIIDLSRNFGKEAALTAGLDHACGDAIIPMDVDLQDPPELIPEMLQKWQQGYEVVMAIPLYTSCRMTALS